MVITDLWKYYGSQLIFQEVSATIGPQDRIGLVGANGVGKTTLLRVLAREESMDRGELSYGKNYTIGYLAQENAALEVNLQTYLEGPFHHILDLIKKMRTIEKQLADPDVHNDEARLKRTMRMYANLQNQFEHVGGYSYTVQIRAAALGLLLFCLLP
jgi:ATP-binding cassette subfamily F protein 3